MSGGLNYFVIGFVEQMTVIEQVERVIRISPSNDVFHNPGSL